MVAIRHYSLALSFTVEYQKCRFIIWWLKTAKEKKIFVLIVQAIRHHLRAEKSLPDSERQIRLHV